MGNSIEFHDSTLSTVTHEGESVLIGLDAYVHRWARVDGAWKGTGWVQPVQINVVGAATVTVPNLPVALHGGRVAVGRVMHENFVPLPFASAGPVSLRLDLVTGVSLEVSGRQVAIDTMGNGRHIEDLPDDFRPGAG